MAQERLDETENVASATECTGLMPALPPNQSDGAEHEARLYAIHQPKKKRRDKCAKREKTRR